MEASDSIQESGMRDRPQNRHKADPSLQTNDVFGPQQRAKEQAALEVHRRDELRDEMRLKEVHAMTTMVAEQKRMHVELTNRHMELDLKAKQELKQAKELKLAALSSAASVQRSKSASERRKTDQHLETKAASACAKRSTSVSERKKIDPRTAVDSEITSARSESHASLDSLMPERSTALREPDARPTITVAVMGPKELRRRLLANLLFVLDAWDRGAFERFQAKEVEGRRLLRNKAKLMWPPAVDLYPGRLSLLECLSPTEDLGGAQAIIAHADIALLVVPAVEARLEERGMLAPGSGQIWEQAVLIRASGVRMVIVAIDGMEDPRVSWRQVEFEALREKLTLLLSRLGLCETFYVPISSLFRSMLKERHVEGVWFTGRTVLGLIAECSTRRALGQTGSLARRATAEKDSPCFVPTEASSNISSVTCKVEGFVHCGVLRPGWRCVVMPSGQDYFTVQEILSPDGFLLTCAPAGERVIVKLESSPVPRVALGEVLCCGIDIHGAQHIKVALQILDTDRDVQITSGFQCTFCAFGGESACELSTIFEAIDLETGTKLNRPEIVGTQTLLTCSLQLDRPLVLGVCTERDALGHFVLRMGASLIAVGWVVALARDVVF